LIQFILSLRPKQWTKNLLVFAGYLFTIQQDHPPGTFARVLAAFALFCAVSGVGYVINDARDVGADRIHPRKRLRPIAAGKLSPVTAMILAVILLVGSLAASYVLDIYFATLIAAYFVLTMAYSVVLKHLVIIDLLSIAAGFVMRAVAGAMVVWGIDPITGTAQRVAVSPWLLVCTTLLALFLGLAKRRGELVTLDNGTDHRTTLGRYSESMLDQMLNISASAALMAYFLYTFAPGSTTAAAHPYMMITIPFVIYGLFRYLFLIHSKNAGASPEAVLLEDKPLLINVILYIVAAGVALKL